LKSSQEILEYFKTTPCESGAFLEIELAQSDVMHIGYKAFVDLAQLFMMRLHTPIASQKSEKVLLRFEKLDTQSSFHKIQQSEEKYGVESVFFGIDKTSQFSFLYHYQHALEFVQLSTKQRILNLGINKGDEFTLIRDLLGTDSFSSKEFVGIDYSASAISYAKEQLPESNVHLHTHDINHLDTLELGKFDLLISIGTLQSSSLNFNEKFMDIYQNHLEKDASIILGFPNCRWIDGEMIYGAKAPNYPFSEMSLVLKDIHFCKKYLQQKKYRVIVTGKDYLFLSARKLT
jgi:2-polyprenyl-3-methyl-5-hydroxy-6-metoxy-1,4-benzoquinol methylase